MDFKDLIGKLDQLNEAEMTSRKVAGKKYGGAAQHDDDEDDEDGEKKAAAPAEKRGRGRPKKAGGDAQVKAGYGGAKDLQDFMVGNIPKKSKELEKLGKTKHKLSDKEPTEKKKVKESLKDWIAELDQLMEAEQLTIEPAKASTQVIKQGSKVLGQVSNPQLAATIKQAIGKGEMTLAGSELDEDSEDYSAKKARAGKDIGEPGKMFSKIAKDAAERYGSNERGEKVAGAVLAKLRKTNEADMPPNDSLSSPLTLESKKGVSKVKDKPFKPFDESKKGVAEAKNHMGETEYNTYAGWKSACRKAGADKFEGDSDICQAMKDGKGIGEWDGASGSVYDDSHKKKKKVDEGSENKTPSMAHIKKMCKDGKTVAEICKMHPNCNQAELKKMIADCKKKMVAEGNLNEFYPSPEFGGGGAGGDGHDNYRGIYLHTAMLIDLSKFKNPETAQYLIAHRVAKLVDPVDDEKVLRAYNEALIKQREIRRNRRKNSKQGISEGMDQRLKAAHHHGKAHALAKEGYNCRYDEGTEESRMYHEGYIMGLDECYGIMPLRGVVGEESEQDVVDNMASFGAVDEEYGMMEDEMEEGNAFTAALAKTPRGGKFSVGGKTFTDNTGYDAKVDEMSMAFEGWDKQLSSLLIEGEEVVEEGMSISVSKGQQGSPDSVSVTASDSDADKLMALVRQMGILGDEAPASDYGSASTDSVQQHGDLTVVDDHDGMMALIKKVAGPGMDSGMDSHGSEDYADEEGHSHEETCNECGGMMEAGHSCGQEVMGEMEDYDQEEEIAAEGAPDSDEAETAADEESEAEEDQALATKSISEEDEEDEEEGGYDAEGNHRPGGPYDAGGHYVGGYRGYDDYIKDRELDEEQEDEKEEDGLEESFANSADDTFEADMDFMTKVISGGLNKQKSTGQSTTPVVASQMSRLGNPMSESNDLLSDWRKLSGIK